MPLRHATENLSGQQLALFSMTSLDIQPTLDYSASDKQTRSLETHSSAEITGQLHCVDV
jgi:hypothetical protein